ncbi:Histidine protein methyltransferase 1-like protein isoform X1 [Oopsacas minuta]|uniref:protein-histidine N-methyltransferase n=1 Tax=Oopsacas minuta TaxID=111878 RepID=A0AAV7JKF4_9METZ|nr:Histidine protein methyltransferase 1-like protein isoform X1 [Oopsacas minuta]
MAFKFNFFTPIDVTSDTNETIETKPEFLDKSVTKVELTFLQQEPTLVPYYSTPTVRVINGIELNLSLNPTLKELENIYGIYPGAKTEDNTLLFDWFKGPSDLVPGIYEGGFRLWEGAVDLVEYLTSQEVEFGGKMILELGTGIGLPGILALKRGGKVWFQEYNIEVLQCATIPHSFMNIGNHDDVFKYATYISGSWSSLVPYSKENSLIFDIILMSETIYEVSNYLTLLELIDETLVPNGTVIIAAKQTYFGLSGSIKEFKDFVTQNGKFRCSTVVTIETSVPREILILSRKIIPDSTAIDIEEFAIEIGAENCSIQKDESDTEFWQFKTDLESYQFASKLIREKKFIIIEQRTEFFPRLHSQLTADQFEETAQVLDKLNGIEDVTGVFDNISCKELDIQGSAIAY